jgi:F-box/leucine-rich repeat protein 2/20
VSGLYHLIHNCPLLEEVDMLECREVDNVPEFTSEKINSPLMYLNLRFAKLTDHLLGYVAASCPKLETLILESCESVTDSGMMQIAKNCRNLVTLDLSFCFITDLSMHLLTLNANSNSGGSLKVFGIYVGSTSGGL